MLFSVSPRANWRQATALCLGLCVACAAAQAQAEQDAGYALGAIAASFNQAADPAPPPQATDPVPQPQAPAESLSPDIPAALAPYLQNRTLAEAIAEARARIEALERYASASQSVDTTPIDTRPTLKLGGQLIIDSVWFSQSPRNIQTVGRAEDSVDFRRARLYAQGDAYDVFHYAIGFDFAQGTADDGRPAFIDNYIGVRRLPILGNLRVGRFFEPFTLDRTSSNRNLSFMERALTDAFAPGRNTGVMAYDQNQDQSVYWAVAGFRGGTDNNGDDAGDQRGWALTSRLVVRPYYDEPSNGRYFMHLGLGYSLRNATDATFQYRSRPEILGHGQADTDSTPFFVDTGVIAADFGQLCGTEFCCVQGPLIVQSEWVLAKVNRFSGDDVVFQGAYAQVGYMLTGESRPYTRDTATLDRVVPFENVFRLRDANGSIIQGRGAWETLVRVSRLNLNDQDVQGGVLTDLTLGVNWYLTPYNRMKFNWILAHLEGVPEGPSDAKILGIRFDADF